MASGRRWRQPATAGSGGWLDPRPSISSFAFLRSGVGVNRSCPVVFVPSRLGAPVISRGVSDGKHCRRYRQEVSRRLGPSGCAAAARCRRRIRADGGTVAVRWRIACYALRGRR